MLELDGRGRDKELEWGKAQQMRLEGRVAVLDFPDYQVVSVLRKVLGYHQASGNTQVSPDRLHQL